MDSNRELHLLPTPKLIDYTGGERLIGENATVFSDGVDSRVRKALDCWLREFPRVENQTAINVAIEPQRFDRPDSYRLAVSLSGIELTASNDAAAFWGVQTLRQLCSDGFNIPCCVIHDWPDFATRGLLHDITRGKVPTLGTLKRLVDQLSLLKVNQLQLYIEHAFVFSFDSEICSDAEGLTPDEVRELDQYCRERFIDLVPSLATFGHMGRILSMPKYRHLAEIEATKTWPEMAWPERMRGFTLDCMNPEAHRLMERMWSDILDAFSSPIVNICGDEPWDLGQGKNKDRLGGEGKGGAYLDQIRRTHEFCQSRGRQTQFWSDVVTHYPKLFEHIPKDATVLHWGYDERSDYEGTRRFVETGLPTIVCPGVSGWKRVLNGMNLAERNLATFAEAGRRHGAQGLLNTDWGDHGHFNLLGCSLHGIVLGAALAWDSKHVTRLPFERLFASAVLGHENDAAIAPLRTAARLGDECESWRLMWQSLEQNIGEKVLPDADLLNEVKQESRSARLAFIENARHSTMVADDLGDLATALRFNELAAEKLLLVRDLRRAERGVNPRRLRDWADRVLEAIQEYEARWMARNKSSGLHDIRAALNATADDVCMRARAAS